MKKQYNCWTCLDGERPSQFVKDELGRKHCPDCGRRPPSYKGYIGGLKTLRDWIYRRECALWQREGYIKDLDKLAKFYDVPVEGYKTWDKVDILEKYLSKNKLHDTFWSHLGETVKKYANERLSRNSSSRLDLDSDWAWAVYNHLVMREKGREMARFMVEQMSLPREENVFDRYGNIVETRLGNIKSNIPISEAIIREARKYHKGITHNRNI
jgi:hypothetical protein